MRDEAGSCSENAPRGKGATTCSSEPRTRARVFDAIRKLMSHQRPPKQKTGFTRDRRQSRKCQHFAYRGRAPAGRSFGERCYHQWRDQLTRSSCCQAARKASPPVHSCMLANVSSDPVDASDGVLTEPAFPDTNDAPTLCSKHLTGLTVSGSISIDLFSPILRICLWSQVPSTAMPMPETAVNEHGNLCFRPHEVGSSGERLLPTPTAHLRFSKQGGQSLFRRSVTPAAHTPHELPARQAAKRRALLLSITRPSAHSPAPSMLAPRLLIARRTCLPASLAYSGGTALPIKLHTASISSVTKR